MPKKALNLNIDEQLFNKLTEYRKLKDVTATSVIEELIDGLDVTNVNVKPDSLHNGYISENTLIEILTPLADRLNDLERYKLTHEEHSAVQNLDKYYIDLLETIKPYLNSLAEADMDRLLHSLVRQLDPAFDTMIGQPTISFNEHLKG